MIHFFSERKEQFQKEAETLNEKYKELSIIRVVVFVLLLIGLLILLDSGLFLIFTISMVVSFFVFGILVKYHKKVKEKATFYANLSKANEDEVHRLQIKLQAFDDGQRYLDEHHSYAFDLDVFGKHSLFQLLSRCTTIFGKDLLAKDLRRAQSPKTIKSRHEAINEIKDQVDWRQTIHAAGLDQQKINNEDLEAFYHWLGQEQKIRHLPLLSGLAVVVWILFVVISYFIFTGQIPYYWIFGFNILALITLGPKLKIIRDITVVLSKVKVQLSAVSDIITHLDHKEFDNEYLRNLSSALKEGKTPASQAIKKLSTVVDLLNNRGNNLYLAANSFLLFDFFLLQRAEKWKGQYASHVKGWFNTIAQFEVILSYSAFAFANKNYTFPTIADNGYKISGKQIGHPLIESKKLVVNDFDMQGKGAISLITGSNMAGKSTFLRSLGVNLVLAQVGAPVCASSFSFSPLNLFTSMRTKDNLEENISTFYAELLRINALLKSIGNDKPTFFLLDEILKGTNSHDRHKGAEALMRQLNQSDAFGLVSTHDVELHSLSKKMADFKNYSFHSEMVDGNIHFDYILQDGPCLNFNAIELMKQMGITVK